MRYILYVPAFGWNVIAWPLIMMVALLSGSSLKWQRPPKGDDLPGLWALMPINSLVVRLFRYFRKNWGAITLGHGGLIAADAAGISGGRDRWTATEQHESIHIEQLEAISVMTLSLAAWVLWRTGDYWTAQLVWSSCWPVFIVSGTLTAILRGENHYTGAHHEEAAYRGVDHGE